MHMELFTDLEKYIQSNLNYDLQYMILKVEAVQWGSNSNEHFGMVYVDISVDDKSFVHWRISFRSSRDCAINYNFRRIDDDNV